MIVDGCLLVLSMLDCEKLKLVLIFSAMRHRAEGLRKKGWRVDYIELTGSFADGLQHYVRQRHPQSVLVQEPSQHNFRQALPALSRQVGVPIEVLPRNQFLVPDSEFRAWGWREQAVTHGKSLPPCAKKSRNLD